MLASFLAGRRQIGLSLPLLFVRAARVTFCSVGDPDIGGLSEQDGFEEYLMTQLYGGLSSLFG